MNRKDQRVWKGIAKATLSLVVTCLPILAYASLLPPSYINSVVALGIMQTITDVGHPPRTEWQTLGTGFFYGYLVQDDLEVTKRRYATYLITAKHVVKDFLSTARELSVRLNPKESTPSREFAISNWPQPDSGKWFCHPDPKIDIAAVTINFDYLKELGIEPNFFSSDENAANKKLLKNLEVTAGDGAFVLGFPMGLSGAQRNYVIVRQGAIARIAEMLEGASPTFMMDALIFPGNSGGPVVLKPEIAAIAGTKSQLKSHLIGLVTNYRPYIDTAISAQTNRPRITFEENSGLADVLPTDVIDDAIRASRESPKDVGGPQCVFDSP